MPKKAIPMLVVILVILVAAAGYLFMQITSMKKDPDAAARAEAEALVLQVEKLILLPKDEIPTVATVSDPTKLADQAFFAKAKVGDKVLLYTNAKKAYLFDPKANRILEVAPLNLGEAAAPTVKAPVKVEEPTEEAPTETTP
jgi:hypothetical protein